MPDLAGIAPQPCMADPASFLSEGPFAALQHSVA
jgi:hypothetical protein